MRTFTKNISAFGMLLAASHSANGMWQAPLPQPQRTVADSVNLLMAASSGAISPMWIAHSPSPEIQETEGGFRICNLLTQQWGPEIPGHLIRHNFDGSLAIVSPAPERLGRPRMLCTVVETATGRELSEPIMCNHCGFSRGLLGGKTGKFVYFYTAETDSTTLGNTENGQTLILPGGDNIDRDAFSYDEKFVALRQRINGAYYITLFSTQTGWAGARFRGWDTIAIKHTPNMLIGRYDPLLINTATGQLLGHLKGEFIEIDLTQKIILLDRQKRRCSGAKAAFYSAENGQLLETRPGGTFAITDYLWHNLGTEIHSEQCWIA